MERDGYCQSLWQQGIQNYKTDTLALATVKKADVVIVGGGITGISTALQLQKAGRTCVVVEAHNLGFGTTGGTTAHLNTVLDTPYYKIRQSFGEKNAQLVAQLAQNAIELIKRNIREYTISCGFKELPGYIFAQDEEQSNELDKILEGTKAVGLPANYSGNIPVPIPFQKAIVIEGQAQFHPMHYLYGIANAFAKAGGIIVQNCRVTGLQGNANEAEVITTMGKIKAGAVVYATHIPPGVNILHFRCAPYRSYAMAIVLKDDNYPQATAYDTQDPYHYYRTQEVNGKRYLIAGGEDHKTAHEENTRLCFTKLESYVRKFYNIERVEHYWSSQYFEPADGLPYIGELPGNPDNVFTATGFSGNGMIYGVGSALILADLITTGKSEYKELFNPKRVKPIAGFESIVKEAADVAGKFIGDRIAIKKIKEVTELAKGEARVVKYEGKSVALYKDEDGKLHAVNPSCPHINCVVGWNMAERSWDCPCHGSRFSCDGELLTGPSQSNLGSIDLNHD